MTQPISRLYSSPENAASVVSELKEGGFANTSIHVFAPPDDPANGDAAGGDAAGGDDIAAAVRQAGLPKAHAEAYAEAVRQGKTLVTVQAPFGFATSATAIMDKHSPSDAGLPDPGYEVPVKDPAAPLSSALGWRVLSSDPTLLSTLLKLPTLSARKPMPRRSDAELADDPAPLSKKVGMEVLSDNPTPLSAKVGWRVLLHNPTPLSSWLGWKVLSDNPRLPATRLGMAHLSDDPAPLSSWLGWKVLSNDPAPLSRKFGWRVLSGDPKPKP